MAIEETKLLLKYADNPDYTPDIDCYLRHGGYEDLKKAFKMKPEEIREEELETEVRGAVAASWKSGKLYFDGEQKLDC